MEYLAAHAGYTRVRTPRTGEKDLVRLPGLVAIAYQYETSRCGDPHLHTHVIVPNRQARADGQLVSIDGTSLYHEARAAGVIYQDNHDDSRTPNNAHNCPSRVVFCLVSRFAWSWQWGAHGFGVPLAPL